MLEYTARRERPRDCSSECNQWLGPDQPGLTNPDFTDGSAPASRAGAARSRPPTSVGERRSEGQPDAGPVKGQRDISKPQIVLPPDLQQPGRPL